MPDDLSEQIAEAAQKPQTVKVDGQELTNRSVEEMIKADQYGKASTGIDSPHRGLRFTKLIPPPAY